jgi:hypothetical protein
MLIASEGDERLAQLANYADIATVACAGALVLTLVLGGAAVRSFLKRKTRMHLLLNVGFFLFLLSTGATYYVAYLTLNPLLVGFAIKHRLAEARLPAAPQDALLAALTKKRAQEALAPSSEFGCFYPGWPARFLPLVLIPAVIILRYAVLRRKAAL